MHNQSFAYQLTKLVCDSTMEHCKRVIFSRERDVMTNLAKELCYDGMEQCLSFWIKEYIAYIVPTVVAGVLLCGCVTIACSACNGIENIEAPPRRRFR